VSGSARDAHPVIATARRPATNGHRALPRRIWFDIGSPPVTKRELKTALQKFMTALKCHYSSIMTRIMAYRFALAIGRRVDDFAGGVGA